jgi:WD40 repeat protein
MDRTNVLTARMQKFVRNDYDHSLAGTEVTGMTDPTPIAIEFQTLLDFIESNQDLPPSMIIDRANTHRPSLVRKLSTYASLALDGLTDLDRVKHLALEHLWINHRFGNVQHAQLSPNGMSIVVDSPNGPAFLASENGQQINHGHIDTRIAGNFGPFGFSPDGKILAAVTNERSVTIYSSSGVRITIRDIVPRSLFISSIGFISGNEILVTSSKNKIYRLVIEDFETQKVDIVQLPLEVSWGQINSQNG